ncbi:glycosyltransferase family 4 protein [Neolewinella aurantiaca]|uniref:Glycosyltransferase family 4 protein n=1 Tax=Neolewinella aurantiaca TaxID=2602767 RepID=A0A5C7FWB9_9BACT|nr:glycosyltransferase family 4 protein [Neolewinella aurantiaca]TXF90965.1 glycosyltransferase family 4 protein [Neolewinella aurantiaca]
MIVAVVANTAWNLLNFRKSLIGALLAENHRVVLLAPDGPECEQLSASGAEFIRLRHLRRKGVNPLRDLALLYELRTVYAREKIDVALHFTIKPVIYGSFAARMTGVRNISTLTGLGYTFLSGGWANGLVRSMYRIALRHAAAVLFHNHDDRQLFLDGGLVTEAQSQVVAGSGLQLDDYPLSPYEEAIPNRFLFVARLLTDKGIREYVAAAEAAREVNPELSFHILGPLDPENPAGIKAEELERWVAEGIIAYDGVSADVWPHLARASVVVLPSYREGCPRVLLEGGAVGRPLLTTDVPGCRAVVTAGENGCLVPACNADALARAMLEMSALPKEELKAMGLRGRKIVEEQFDDQVVNRVYLSKVNIT